LQQSLYAEIIVKKTEGIVPIICDRIAIEKNDYVKAFCYRLLLNLDAVTKISEQAKRDVNSDCLELKLAVLRYIGSIDDHAKVAIIYGLVNDSHWQVRALVAKLLAEIKNEKSIEFLSAMLRDSQWWVRVNAANALLKHGTEGIAVLKSQNPSIDRFAYETAQEVLLEHGLK
jgi:HEAT repeat protein